MVDKLLKLSLSLAVIILASAIVAGPLVGSPRPQFGPVLAFARGLWRWVFVSVQDAGQPETSPRPFLEEAGDAAERLKQGAEGLLDNIPDDPRLAICPQGSIESTALEEIPLATARKFKQRVERGDPFVDLIEVQVHLGEPACNYRSGSLLKWRYLVEELRIIDAEQQGSTVRVQFTNF